MLHTSLTDRLNILINISFADVQKKKLFSFSVNDSLSQIEIVQLYMVKSSLFVDANWPKDYLMQFLLASAL